MNLSLENRVRALEKKLKIKKPCPTAVIWPGPGYEEAKQKALEIKKEFPEALILEVAYTKPRE